MADTMIDKLTEVLASGQRIVNRHYRTERDILHHLIAPIIECIGWRKDEIYFEWKKNTFTPDISIILEGNNNPLFTIEAKSPDQNIYHLSSGESIKMNYLERERDNPLDQLFRQLVCIERDFEYRIGCLTNGIKFGIFTITQIDSDTFLLTCLKSCTLNNYTNKDNHIAIEQLLSKENLVINNGAEIKSLILRASDTSMHPMRDNPPITMHRVTKTRKKLHNVGQPLTSTLTNTVKIPNNYVEIGLNWANNVKITETQHGIMSKFINDFTTEPSILLKQIHFECLRYMHEISSIMPSDWKLVMKMETNIVIHLTPKWISEEILNAVGDGEFLCQMRAHGKNPGTVWFRVPNKYADYPPDSDLYKLYKVKKHMDNQFNTARRAKAHIEGATDLLIKLLIDASEELFTQGIIYSNLKKHTAVTP